MRVLAFGTYDAELHPRVAVLIEGLRARGHVVDECNIPLGLSTQRRVATLQQPWRLTGFGLRILHRWLGLARRARRTDRPDVVLVGYLGHFDVLLARRLFRGVPLVLDHLVSGAETAVDRQLGGGLATRVLRWLDRRAVAAADIVVVDTEEHRDLVPVERRAEAVVVAVGAGEPWFAAATAAARQPDEPVGPLSVVFFGVFTPLQGAPVIGAALGQLSGEPIEVTMIGHGQELSATVAAARGNDRVSWKHWVPAGELPALVAAHDVCLGIFGAGSKARHVVPTKVFQGLAAGTAVVTSDTPPQRRVLGSAAVLVPPGDPTALADVLRDLASDPVKVRTLRTAGAAAARDIAAAEAVTAPLDVALTERIPRLLPRLGKPLAP